MSCEIVIPFMETRSVCTIRVSISSLSSFEHVYNRVTCVCVYLRSVFNRKQSEVKCCYISRNQNWICRVCKCVIGFQNDIIRWEFIIGQNSCVKSLTIDRSSFPFGRHSIQWNQFLSIFSRDGFWECVDVTPGGMINEIIYVKVNVLLLLQ